jgi:hypothetical protein
MTVMVFGPDLKGYLAQLRWRVETIGITVGVNGEAVPLSTARGDDRIALHVTYSAIGAGLRADGAAFKFADGKSRPVSNAEMAAAITLAFRFVQHCFDAENVVLAKIEDGSLATTPQLDQAFFEALTTPPASEQQQEEEP